MSESGFLSGLLASTPAPAAVEITARRINAVSLAAGRTVTAHVTAPLPEGLVTPSLNATNVHHHDALSAAIKNAVDGLSPRPRRIALVLPDTVAKVSLVRFEKTPPRAQDLDQLIKWQMRKAAPFRIEDAQIAWSESGPIEGGGREYLVVLARRDIVESYERACEMAASARRCRRHRVAQHRQRGARHAAVRAGRRLVADSHGARVRDDCSRSIGADHVLSQPPVRRRGGH